MNSNSVALLLPTWTTGLPSHSALPHAVHFTRCHHDFCTKKACVTLSLPCWKHFQGSSQPVGESPALFRGLPALWWEAGQSHYLLLPALNLVLLIPWAVSHLRVLLPFSTSLSSSLFCKILLKGFLPSDTLGWVVCPTSALLQNSVLFFPHCLSHVVFMRGSYEFFESRGPCLNYLFPQAGYRNWHMVDTILGVC